MDTEIFPAYAGSCLFMSSLEQGFIFPGMVHSIQPALLVPGVSIALFQRFIENQASLLTPERYFSDVWGSKYFPFQISDF